MELKFRELKSNEIECKISQINEKGLSLLLYKTARTDMQLLDETVGAYNWKCEYEEIKGNLYCGISIYDESKKEWITKWDCGVESAFGDKEKGEASDSFKRAGFKWGIGRELYTSPFIYISADKCNIQNKNGKNVCYDKFVVEAIQIKDEEITGLAIKNMTTNKRVFLYKKGE
jgi:hypothetical protein